MREFFEKHKEKIITLLLCGVLLIIVLSVLALISGAIMKVFGFEYRSIGSIILFFIIVQISITLGLIVSALGFIIRQSINAYSNNTLSNLEHIHSFEIKYRYCIPNISAEDISIFVISLIFAFLGVYDKKIA